jgi:hypothetical protein
VGLVIFTTASKNYKQKQIVECMLKDLLGYESFREREKINYVSSYANLVFLICTLAKTNSVSILIEQFLFFFVFFQELLGFFFCEVVVAGLYFRTNFISISR